MREERRRSSLKGLLDVTRGMLTGNQSFAFNDKDLLQRAKEKFQGQLKLSLRRIRTDFFGRLREGQVPRRSIDLNEFVFVTIDSLPLIESLQQVV